MTGFSVFSRWATVVTSAVAFSLCLTRTAFVTPGSVSYETANNSALDQLAYGWIGLVAAVLSVFLPYPFVLASLLLTIILAATNGGAVRQSWLC